MSEQAKVEQRHRDEAVLALWGDVIGKQEPSELSSAPAVQPIAQALANAEAAGYAAGVKDEREECAKVCRESRQSNEQGRWQE